MAEKAKIAAIILASGFSVRFGSNKLLEEIGEAPLIQRAMQNALSSSCDKVFIVVEPENNSIKRLIPPSICIIENTGRSEGISAAVVSGLWAAKKDYDAVIFMVADQPFLGPGVLNDMISAFKNQDCNIIACFHKSSMRNPMMFGSKYYGELLEIKGDTGAKQIAMRHVDDICRVEISDEYTLFDIDTIEDLEDASKILKKIERD